MIKREASTVFLKKHKQRKEKENIDPTKILPLKFLRFLVSSSCYSQSFQLPWQIVVAFYSWLLKCGFFWSKSQLSIMTLLSESAVEDMKLPWPKKTVSTNNWTGPLVTDLEDQIDLALSECLAFPPSTSLTSLTKRNPFSLDNNNSKPCSFLASKPAQTAILPQPKKKERKITARHSQDFVAFGYDAYENSVVPARSQQFRSNRHNTFRATKATFPVLQYIDRSCYWNMINVSQPQIPKSLQGNKVSLSLDQICDRGAITLANRSRRNNSRYLDIRYADFSWNDWSCFEISSHVERFCRLMLRFNVLSFEHCQFHPFLLHNLLSTLILNLGNPLFFAVDFSWTEVNSTLIQSYIWRSSLPEIQQNKIRLFALISQKIKCTS